MTSSPDLDLVADIGGTNTRVALARAGVTDRESIRRFANRDAADLREILAQFMEHSGLSAGALSGVCVAAAGPVRDGVAKMTNLDWHIDRAMLADVSGASRVAVLNDLQAQGYAIGHIADTELRVILPHNPASAHAAKLVIGLGTGFNAAAVFDGPQGRVVPPSESGHITLPTPDDQTRDLARFLAEKHGFAAVEEVLSGRGISHVHAFLHGIDQPAQQIMDALEQDDAKARATAALVAQVLGNVAGDLALVNLPFGGVYLIGGVSRALAPYLMQFGFVDAFSNKGRFGSFMAQFGVSVVEDDFAALTGCAQALIDL